MRAAAVDIGTNSVKMVIGWREADGALHYSEATPIVTRLGKGVDAAGRLSPEAIGRTLTALRGFREQADAVGVSVVRAVGTSALRDAANGAEFLDRATAILGGVVEVISGEREANLVYSAACLDATEMAPDAKWIAATDVGGGSSEIVIGKQAGGEEPFFRTSLQMGAVRLTERTLPSDPPTEAERQTAVAAVDGLLLDVPRPEEAVALIASGGTAANLGAMHLAEANPDGKFSFDQMRDALHGLYLSVEAIEERIERLCAIPLSERRKTPGLEPDRADVIIAGAILQARILRHLKANGLSVSTHGLRYGLLFELLKQG